MADGLRDSFIENDAIGNTNYGTVGVFGRSYSSRRKKRKSIISKIKRAFGRKRKKRVLRKHRVRRHKRGSRGIKYTKNGQPYKIMPNGRARFLKKR